MINKNIILLLLVISILPLLNAVTVCDESCGSCAGDVKQNDPIVLTQYCDTCTYVNVTSIKFPDSTLKLLNASMTRSGVDFFYTYSNTSVLGDYIYNVCGDKDGTFQCEEICYVVNAAGVSQSEAQGLASIAFIVLMMGLTVLFGWMGFKFSESDKLWVMGIFFIFLAVIMIVYDVWLAYEYHRSYTGAVDSSMPEMIFYIFLLILVLGLLVSTALLVLRWKEVARYVKNEIKRKDDDDDEEWERDFRE